MIRHEHDWTSQERLAELPNDEAAAFLLQVLERAPTDARYPRWTSRRIPLVRLLPAMPALRCSSFVAGQDGDPADERPTDPVLVAFCARRGSTAEVAERVARTFRSLGWQTELSPVASRPSPAGRTLVILGAPIYSGRWLRQARQFLRRNRGVLEATPLAVFGMGPREATEEAFRRSRARLERSLARVPWARPVRIGVFGGVDPPRRHPRRGARDWGVIEAWCKDLAAAVGPAPAAPG